MSRQKNGVPLPWYFWRLIIACFAVKTHPTFAFAGVCVEANLFIEAPSANWQVSA